MCVHAEAGQVKKLETEVPFARIKSGCSVHTLVHTEQVLELLCIETSEAPGSLLVKRSIDDLHLCILKLFDMVFDSLGNKDAVHKHLAGLRHAMSPIDGLLFDEGIPERVEDDNARGLPEVQTSIASLD